MRLTGIFIGIVLALIVGYDVYIIYAQGKEASISAYIINMSHNHPSVAFFAGIVCGHLFWRMREKDLKGVNNGAVPSPTDRVDGPS